MVATGVLTAFIAVTAVPARSKGTGVVLLLVGVASVVTMSGINFAIESNFRWLVLAPAILWFVGLASYVLEKRE